MTKILFSHPHYINRSQQFRLLPLAVGVFGYISNNMLLISKIMFNFVY